MTKVYKEVILSMKNSPFSDSSLCDLGTDEYGMSLSSVCDMLREADRVPTHACVVCGGKGDYKLIPKGLRYITALVQDKGYVCENCLSMNYIDSSKYGIRRL